MIKMKGRETGGRPAQPSQYALRIVKLRSPNLKYGIPKLKLLTIPFAFALALLRLSFG